VEESDLLVSRGGYFNEPRDVSIYLSRGLLGDTLKDIGKEFDIGKYSVVSNILAKLRGRWKRTKNRRIVLRC